MLQAAATSAAKTGDHRGAAELFLEAHRVSEGVCAEPKRALADRVEQRIATVEIGGGTGSNDEQLGRFGRRRTAEHGRRDEAEAAFGG